MVLKTLIKVKKEKDMDETKTLDYNGDEVKVGDLVRLAFPFARKKGCTGLGFDLENYDGESSMRVLSTAAGTAFMEGVVELPDSVAKNHPRGYFLEVEGDCMNLVYPEGCLILIDPEQQPADGSVAAVAIDGADYVMRRLKRGSSSMMLCPESTNPEHRDIIISEGDGRTVSLVGTVVWYQPAKEME